jgi:hypothetical protein
MKQAKIYTLTHPLTGDVFYVGATVMELHRRLPGGYHSPTYNSLKAAGATPIIEELESVDLDRVAESENYWICQMKAWGFHLENVRVSHYGIRVGKYQRKDVYKAESKFIQTAYSFVPTPEITQCRLADSLMDWVDKCLSKQSKAA